MITVLKYQRYWARAENVVEGAIFSFTCIFASLKTYCLLETKDLSYFHNILNQLLEDQLGLSRGCINSKYIPCLMACMY